MLSFCKTQTPKTGQYTFQCEYDPVAGVYVAQNLILLATMQYSTPGSFQFSTVDHHIPSIQSRHVLGPPEKLYFESVEITLALSVGRLIACSDGSFNTGSHTWATVTPPKVDPPTWWCWLNVQKSQNVLSIPSWIKWLESYTSFPKSALTTTYIKGS